MVSRVPPMSSSTIQLERPLLSNYLLTISKRGKWAHWTQQQTLSGEKQGRLARQLEEQRDPRLCWPKGRCKRELRLLSLYWETSLPLQTTTRASTRDAANPATPTWQRGTVDPNARIATYTFCVVRQEVLIDLTFSFPKSQQLSRESEKRNRIWQKIWLRPPGALRQQW